MQKIPPASLDTMPPNTSTGSARPDCDPQEDARRAWLIADIARIAGLPALKDALNAPIADRAATKTAPRK